jgi:hypothetical protein
MLAITIHHSGIHTYKGIGLTSKEATKSFSTISACVYVPIFTLIYDINHTCKVENSSHKGHGDNGWIEALFVYILPSICNFFSEFIDCFFFCSTMLFHVAFNCRGAVSSLLLKLEKLNFNVRRLSARHMFRILK